MATLYDLLKIMIEKGSLGPAHNNRESAKGQG